MTLAYNREDVSEYWRSLAVDADLVETLTDLNLVWRNGALFVSSACQGDPDCLEQVSGAVLYLFRFRRFTESRWATVGEASRGLVGALSVGLEAYVACLRKVPGVSDWHLRGFSRLTPEVKRFVCVAGVAAFIPDGVLVALLQDDRVVQQLPELERALSEEHDWLSHLATPLWRRLASVTEETSYALRSDALRVATVVAGYIANNIFKVARSYPWSLAVGDVAENLDRLVREQDVHDIVALKRSS